MHTAPAYPVPVGGRRVPRPRTVERCPRCGEALGAGYATCAACHDAVECIWLADWAALLAAERVAAGSSDEPLLAQVVLAEFGRHPWTVADIAMSLLRCDECGAELGEGYPDCGACGLAFGASIQAEFGATANEHALHIGRWVLRYPQTHSANAVAAWRLTTPRILTGWLPDTAGAHRMMALIKAGRLEEVQAAVARIDGEIARRAQAL